MWGYMTDLEVLIWKAITLWIIIPLPLWKRLHSVAYFPRFPRHSINSVNADTLMFRTDRKLLLLYMTMLDVWKITRVSPLMFLLKINLGQSRTYPHSFIDDVFYRTVLRWRTVAAYLRPISRFFFGSLDFAAFNRWISLPRRRKSF
jgi:hypothetical protein